MSRRRVVVTGLGLVTPIGNTVEEAWDNALAGKSGGALIDGFDTENYRVKIGATIKDFNLEDHFDAKTVQRCDPFMLIGQVAATQALAHAGFDESIDRNRAGVAMGSGIGGIRKIEDTHSVLIDRGPRRVSPFFVPSSVINMLPGNVSIEHGLRGPNVSIVTACTTGTHNIGFAARTIQYGEADIMIAGGSEASTSPVTVAGFASMKALSTRNDEPEKASRPWDQDRDGFLLGDGAGAVVLEEYEHAKARDATILCELTGFSMTADAHHITSPPDDGAGAVGAMKIALEDAGLNPEDIDYINAHGTSTPQGDVAETRAIKGVFGDSTNILISSSKSMIGHLLGAAGAVEAVFSILSIRDQAVHATINLDNPSEDCDLDYVPHTARQHEVKHVLSNSFGFGGTNGTLIFSQI